MTSSAKNRVSRNNWLCTQTRGDRIEFEWTIEKFHQLPQKNGEDIQSPLFPKNSTEQWRIEVCPRGWEKHDAEWISVYLRPASDKMLGIKVQIEITIFRLKKALGTETFTYKFDKIVGHGSPKLIERSKLSVKDDPSDSITIRCKIGVLGTYITSSSKNKSSDTVIPFEKQENRLAEDLQSLYKKPTFTDFTVISGNKTFPTHKLILASRSPVFAAMFEHEGVQENIENELKIENFEPAVVEGLLEFIYTDDVAKIGELTDGLLVAADQYELKRLKHLCEETLYKTLTVANAAELLVLADLHSATQLKKHVMQFIVENPKDVLKSKAFTSVEMPLDLAKEMMCAVVLSANEDSLS